jgi:hypothetical protein
MSSPKPCGAVLKQEKFVSFWDKTSRTWEAKEDLTLQKVASSSITTVEKRLSKVP